MAPSFRKSLLDSIQVVMATTGELALRIDDKTQACSVPSKDVCASIHDKPVSPSIWVNNQEDSVAKCIEVIEATLDELEYTAFSQHGVTTGIEGSNPINVSFSVIDSSPIGYKYLSRQWIRDSLSMNQLSCRLNFDLPSAIDGTHCSVAFEAAYQIYPFAINSLQAKMLSSDLYYLSHLDFQVTQLVPLSSIDTSLLFGIPMKVRAGLENDYAHFQEMSVIVRTLFRLLQERELAILLRGTAKRTDESAYNSASRYGLFQSHSSSMEQMFVLMAQEVPSLAGHSPPSGLLCRIAHADQLLVEATKPTALGEAKYMASDQELEAQYTEYIEEALSRVDLGPFNPFDVASQQLTCSHRHGSNDCSSKVEALNATYDLLKVLSTCGSNHAYTPVECDPQSTSASGVFDDSAGIGSTIATENDYDVFIDGDILIFKDSQQWPSCVWNDRSSIGASDDRPTQETMAEDEETDVHTSSHDAEHY